MTGSETIMSENQKELMTIYNNMESNTEINNKKNNMHSEKLDVLT